MHKNKGCELNSFAQQYGLLVSYSIEWQLIEVNNNEKIISYLGDITYICRCAIY